MAQPPHLTGPPRRQHAVAAAVCTDAAAGQLPGQGRLSCPRRLGNNTSRARGPAQNYGRLRDDDPAMTKPALQSASIRLALGVGTQAGHEPGQSPNLRATASVLGRRQLGTPVPLTRPEASAGCTEGLAHRGLHRRCAWCRRRPTSSLLATCIRRSGLDCRRNWGDCRALQWRWCHWDDLTWCCNNKTRQHEQNNRTPSFF